MYDVRPLEQDAPSAVRNDEAGSPSSLIRELQQASLHVSGRRPLRFTPRQFFTRLLPMAMEKARARGVSLSGRLTFMLAGSSFTIWTVDLGQGAVREGPVPRSETDMVIALWPDDLLNLLRNQLDVAEAHGAGRLKLEGDLEVLDGLSRLLQEGALQS